MRSISAPSRVREFALYRATNCMSQAGESSQIHHGYPGRKVSGNATRSALPAACLGDEFDDLVDAGGQIELARFGLASRQRALAGSRGVSLSSIDAVIDQLSALLPLPTLAGSARSLTRRASRPELARRAASFLAEHPVELPLASEPAGRRDRLD
jgi:hypothetical protein